TWYRTRWLLEHGVVDLRPLITHRYGLAEFERAFAQLASGEACKIVLDPGVRREPAQAAAAAAALDALRGAGTFKHFNTLLSPQGPVVEMDGRGEVIVLSSNNYLGLAADARVVEAGIEGLRRYGAGTASVRFICGTFAPHLELER